MRLTNEILKQGKSENGGWSKKQLRCFGLRKLKKGWKSRIIGKDFSTKAIEKFLSLKNVHVIEQRQARHTTLDDEFNFATDGL